MWMACIDEPQKRLTVMPPTLMRQAGEQSDDAAQIVALRTFRIGTSEN